MDDKRIFDITGMLDGVGACFFSLKRRGRKMIAETRFDLTFEQVVVMSILRKHEGLNLSELADLCDRDKTTTSRMITGLEKRNLVLRVPDKQDSRQKLIYLTHEAKVTLDHLEALKSEVEAMATEGLSKEEQELCRKILEKVAANLQGE